MPEKLILLVILLLPTALNIVAMQVVRPFLPTVTAGEIAKPVFWAIPLLLPVAYFVLVPLVFAGYDQDLVEPQLASRGTAHGAACILAYVLGAIYINKRRKITD